jgi:hypothetical protein
VRRTIVGRYAEAAIWVLVALRSGPRGSVRLLDDVRSLAGRIGPGTLFGAIARLERLELIEPAIGGGGPMAYRLHEGLAAAAERTG